MSARPVEFSAISVLQVRIVSIEKMLGSSWRNRVTVRLIAESIICLIFGAHAAANYLGVTPASTSRAEIAAENSHSVRSIWLGFSFRQR